MPLIPVLLSTVLACLTNGSQVTIQDPQFTGFIETRGEGQAFLLYRQDGLRGEISTDRISRIVFGYQRGRPFPLVVTLKDGQSLQVQSNRRDFLQIRGMGPNGTVMLQHPDPLSVPLKLTTHSPDRLHDLTISCLEFRE